MATNESDCGAAATPSVPATTYQQAGMGAVWQRGADVRSQSFGPATALMLDLAEIQLGDTVLDVATGTGDTAILAAGRVGPSGRVLATDIAAPMLEGAADEIRQAGLANVETQVMDARRLDLESESFDAVISRMGIMLMPEREKALAEMRRVLKSRKRLAVIVWSTGERNLGAFLPLSIGWRHAGLPTPPHDHPGMFALGPPGLLARTLAEAGFRDVAVRAVPAPRAFVSVEDLMRYLTGSTPMLRESLSKLDESGQTAMLTEIAETMRQFVAPDGTISIPGEVLVGVGTK